MSKIAEIDLFFTELFKIEKATFFETQSM